jgi:hypothetical protein
MLVKETHVQTPPPKKKKKGQPQNCEHPECKEEGGRGGLHLGEGDSKTSKIVDEKCNTHYNLLSTKIF